MNQEAGKVVAVKLVRKFACHFSKSQYFSTCISNEKCQLSINFEIDEKMTKEELQDLFGEKRCKPEPVEPCADSKHGCCPDNFHSAKGPFFEGLL